MPRLPREKRKAGSVCLAGSESGLLWTTRSGNPRKGRGTMAQCATCGNDYDKTFEIRMNGKSYTFDSFECAIQALAPQCSHCGCRILGHGVEGNEAYYCCAHCARLDGVQG